VWPVATYGCESWTLRKNEETRLDAFEMKGLRRTLRVSWTAKETNEWVLNKAGVKRELLDTVKARKLAYYGHTTGLNHKRKRRIKKKLRTIDLSCRRRTRATRSDTPIVCWCCTQIKVDCGLSVRGGTML